MKKIKVKNIILVLLAVICVCVLLYSLYQGLIIYIPQKQEQQRFDELRQIVEQKSKEKSDSTQPSEAETRSGSDKEETHSAFIDLATINDNYKGWLKIEDTVIDYPILQKEGSDDYYLKHNFDQKKGFPGCISIEKYANSCLNDKVCVLYGHNMKNGTMFGGLHRMYRDFEYFKAHEYFYIFTEESVRKYRFICITHYSDEHLLKDDFKMNDDGDFVFEGFKGDEPTKIMQALKDYNDEKAYFNEVDITDEDELMILSTCNTDRTRVVAVGLKIED